VRRPEIVRHARITATAEGGMLASETSTTAEFGRLHVHSEYSPVDGA
jgi:hypothetical protein